MPFNFLLDKLRYFIYSHRGVNNYFRLRRINSFSSSKHFKKSWKADYVLIALILYFIYFAIQDLLKPEPEPYKYEFPESTIYKGPRFVELPRIFLELLYYEGILFKFGLLIAAIFVLSYWLAPGGYNLKSYLVGQVPEINQCTPEQIEEFFYEKLDLSFTIRKAAFVRIFNNVPEEILPNVDIDTVTYSLYLGTIFKTCTDYNLTLVFICELAERYEEFSTCSGFDAQGYRSIIDVFHIIIKHLIPDNYEFIVQKAGEVFVLDILPAKYSSKSIKE